MNTFLQGIVLAAFIAMTFADDVLPDASIKTVGLGPDGTILGSTNFEDGSVGTLSPILASLYGPFLKTVSIYSDGESASHGALETVASNLTPLSQGLQGPTTKSVSVGPDGSIINSFASGGAVSSDGSVLVLPTFYSSYGQSAKPVFVHTVVPTVIPVTRSLVYTPGYYSGHINVPYGKSIVAGASGTIVAK